MFFTQTEELVLGKHIMDDFPAVERILLGDILGAGSFWAPQMSALHSLLTRICSFVREQNEEKQFAMLCNQREDYKELRIFEQAEKGML